LELAKKRKKEVTNKESHNVVTYFEETMKVPLCGRHFQFLSYCIA